jgi:hypothetical protein
MPPLSAALGRSISYWYHPEIHRKNIRLPTIAEIEFVPKCLVGLSHVRLSLEGGTSKIKGEPSVRLCVSRALSHDHEKKTKPQLVDEVVALRQRTGDLEAFEAEPKAIASDLKGTRQRLQYLLAASPAIISTTKVSGGYACAAV